MTDARFTINGDASDQGFEASPGQTLTLQLKTLPAIGVRSVRFLVPDPAGLDPSQPPIYNPPRASKGAPQLTLVGATSGADVIPATLEGTVTCTLPASGAPQSWIVRCVVNDGQRILPDGRAVFDRALVHERMVTVRLNGRRAVVVTETTQFEDDGWAGAISDLPSGGDAGTERDDFTHLSGDLSPNGTRNSALMELVWVHVTNADTAQLEMIDPEPGRPGILRIHSPSANSRVVALYRGLLTDETAKGFRFSDFSRIAYHARISRTVTCSFRLGLTNEVLVAANTIETGTYVGSMFISDSTVFADDNVRCFTADGVGFQVTVLGTMAALGLDTDFHKFEIEQPTLGTVSFKLDGVEVASHSSAVPGASDAPVTPHVYVLNRSGGTFRMDLDLYERSLRQLDR